MSESIKANIAYKSVLTVSSYIISLFTFPYVSRILGVENIGLVSFVDNTVAYFLLFATLGTNILGIREIASVKHDEKKISRVFSNILGLNLLFTVLTLAVYFICIIYVSKFRQYNVLFLIGSAKILSSSLLVEWLFTGVEDFKYITIRSLVVKLLYAVSIFIFIQEAEDYILYFILTTTVVIVNAVVNITYSRRFVKISVKSLFSFKYLKENIVLGVYSIMTSMYLTFNVMLLGLFSNNTEVGYYTTAFKIYSIILGLLSAFTNVMLPRVSSLLAKGENDNFKRLIEKSFSALCMFSIPLIFGGIILAPDLIFIISGSGYEGAIWPMRIIMPAILFVAIAQVLAIQVITPMKKDKVLLIASILGAIVGLILNILIVPNLQSIGSAIVLLGSELIVTAFYIMYIYRTRLVPIPWKIVGKNILYSSPVAIICILTKEYTHNHIVCVLVSVFLSFLIWGVINYFSGSLALIVNIRRRRKKIDHYNN